MYILYINDTNNLQGQYCAMYSQTWDSLFATNNGQYRGSDHFLIEYSYGYSNSTDAGGPSINAAAHQASVDISYATLQPFCSSYLGYTTPSTTTTAASTVFTTTTVTSSANANANAKRALVTEIDGTVYSLPTLPPLSVLETINLDGPNATAALFQKRDAAALTSTPAVLTKYPATVLSSAYSMQATPATVTSIITISTMTTSVSTQTVTPIQTATTTQVLQNADFSSGSFAPWTTLTSYPNMVNFSIVNDEATVTWTTTTFRKRYATISQSIPGSKGTPYHFTADVAFNILSDSSSDSSSDSCTVYFYTSSDYLSTVASQTSGISHVDVKGTFSGTPTWLYLQPACNTIGTTSLAFANVSLYLTM